MKSVEKAVKLLREAGAKPKAYSCYVLVNDIDDAIYRVEFLRSLGVEPFAQPYRDFNTLSEPTLVQKQYARYVNHKAIFKSISWDKYAHTVGVA